MKPVVYTIAWLFAATGIILSSVALAFSMKYGDFFGYPIFGKSDDSTISILADQEPIKPGEQELTAQAEVGDARVILVQNFLERHKSPVLAEDPEFASFLVGIADEHGVDFRLLPAIAMQESNLCKVIPPDSHNCLGLGIHARGTWGFPTYRDNFAAAIAILKKNYIDKGLTTPEQIMRKYTPSSNGSWAASVNQWMAEMRYDDRVLGKELKTDADLLEFTEATPSALPGKKQ